MSDGLRICDLSLQLGDQSILQPLNLELQRGAFGVLIGPSGSGKSSLLRCIAGLQKGHGGSIWIDDSEVSQLDPAQRQLAMVFQDHALFPHLSVLDNLSFGLRARGCARTEAIRQAQAVAERLGLLHCLQRRPKGLSGGEQQRVALGRAMLRQARLVLMDEPLSSLDAPLRARMRQEIAELHREQGWTTLYVTHDQVEAMTMADQLGLLDQGQLLQWGPPQELYHRPSSLAAARFLGQPPMQQLPLHWEKEQAWLGDAPITPPAAIPAGSLAAVRPEDARVTPADPPEAGGDSHMIRATAMLLRRDHLGDRQWLQLQLADQQITVSAAAHTQFSPRQPVHLHIPRSKLCWFDAHTGHTLC
nr:ABC transporter ATP-binding protein [Oceanococcus sp. HetDA_MAG_MS8]